jgi:hypothetical protein
MHGTEHSVRSFAAQYASCAVRRKRVGNGAATHWNLSKTDSAMAAGSAGRPSPGETTAQAAFGCAAAFAWAAAFGRRASIAISARSLRTASRSRELSQARASSSV